MKKLTIIKILLLVIAFFVMVIGISYAFFVNFDVHLEENISYDFTISSDDYLFVVNSVKEVNLSGQNIQNLGSGEYISDNAVINITTSSNNPDSGLACSFDVYYVWDSANRYNTSDITLDESNPFEYSTIIKVDENEVKEETDLSNITFNLNSTTGKYEGIIGSSIYVGAISEVKTHKLSVENRIYNIPSLQENITGKNLSSHLEIRNVNCIEAAITSLYKNGTLKIGDFVTYDAGTWTTEEIQSINVGPNSSLVSASNSTAGPKSAYLFGGFIVGTSRNKGAIERLDPTNYLYAQMYDDGDSINQVPISGWRIFDIDEDNETITLISAANPEDYCTPDFTNGAYISEYILTGNKNSSWSENENDYTKRNWDMYVNENQGALSARLLTYNDLNNWYKKYVDDTITELYGNNSKFQKIYASPYLSYQNLIDNHSYYWLSTANSETYLWYVSPGDRTVYNYYSCWRGVRVLVSISLTSVVTLSGTRTVTEESMVHNGGTYGTETRQNYNVWNLL